MFKKKKDLYIELLILGKKNLISGITYKQALIQLEEIIKSNSAKELFKKLFNEVFFHPRIGIIYTGHGDEERCFLKMEGYFRLLEHEELKSARSSSLVATFLAIIAIIFAGWSTVYEIFFTAPTDIIIQQEQMRKIESLQFDPKIVNSSLENIIENQSKIINILNK